jgi:hypothetical protein
MSDKALDPGLYWHVSEQFGRRLMYVGFVNWMQDPKRGHGTKPTAYMPARLRACRAEHPLTADSLLVSEWGGSWEPKEPS